jgi:hypothetical protein
LLHHGCSKARRDTLNQNGRAAITPSGHRELP